MSRCIQYISISDDVTEAEQLEEWDMERMYEKGMGWDDMETEGEENFAEQEEGKPADTKSAKKREMAQRTRKAVA